MGRPKQWYESNERTVAKKYAKTSRLDCWKWKSKTRTIRDSKAGYYVGPSLPDVLQLDSVTVEEIRV